MLQNSLNVFCFHTVNGTSGEGTSLSIIERQKTTEAWKVACKKYDLTLMVQIGGAAFVDVIEMVSKTSNNSVFYRPTNTYFHVCRRNMLKSKKWTQSYVCLNYISNQNLKKN